MILSTGALRRRGVHGHAWPPVRWQADRRWPGVPVREPQTGSAPGGAGGGNRTSSPSPARSGLVVPAGGGRRVCHGAPATSAPVDHASRTGWGRTVRPPRRSAHAAVSSQPTARRPVDELTSWARVFGTRVVGVTLVHCPCRVLGPLQARGQGACAGQRRGRPHHFACQGCRRVRGDQHDRDARARKAVNGEGQAHG